MVIKVKKGVVTLSFDDGRLDNYAVIKKLLLPNKVPATINIATGYISRELDKIGGRGYSPEPITVDQLQEIANSGLIECASHGHLHKNDWEDISTGRKILLEWLKLNPNTKIGFASPGSGMSPDYIQKNIDELKNLGFCYIRTGFNLSTHKIIRNLCRKVARITHIPFLFSVC